MSRAPRPFSTNGAAQLQDAAADAMRAPSDRFCDVVMEGGVTSGIIYASAAVELARHYRFQSIGGSSIGAFAAALTAAAEYSRRHGSGKGFEELSALPDKLAQKEDGRTLLERLFVPQPRTRRLFQIFLATLGRSDPVASLRAGVMQALYQYGARVRNVTLLALFILAAGPWLTLYQCTRLENWVECSVVSLSWAGAFLLTLVVAPVVAVLSGIVQDFRNGAVPNGFGLCRGWHRNAPNDTLDLAAYLHASIQRVAGREVTDPPLTFRDLWDAPGSPGQMLGYQVPKGRGRSINLEVYASNLTHSRPYRFPLDDAEDTSRLFFRVEELEEYFPKGIVQYLASFSKHYEPASSSDPPATSVARGYLELPGPDLPIVVAARLAMSFPLLISAVPLHAVDHGRRNMHKCWISDGGLCSNFPIHLFDSFLPMWPTFGISLDARDKSDSRAVFLPMFHTGGRGETWYHGPEESRWKLGAFLLSLWQTTWRWNDSTMTRMPGVRDRVVRIFLRPGEGGVNIRMQSDKIDMLSREYGRPAAQAFVERFLENGGQGWREHRWVRFNCLAIALRQRISNFGTAVDLNRHATSLCEEIADALVAAPLRSRNDTEHLWPSETALRPAQIRELGSLVIALRNLERAFQNAGDTEPYRAVPRPSLRTRHPT